MVAELDRKTLRVLASESRLDILKALRPMRRTVSQLSRSLEINKAAVHRHLDKLIEGCLVVRQEDNGYVYYGLSWKGKDLFSSDDKMRIVLLASLAAVLVSAVAFLVAFNPFTAAANGGSGGPTTGSLPVQPETPWEFGLILALAVILIATAAWASITAYRTARKLMVKQGSI